MATPTPSHPPPQPSSASKKPAGHVTTPSNRGIPSPAPRSVPSPAATRKEHSGKTPVNHSTSSSHSGSKTLGGTPMVHNLSQTGLNAASPGHVGGLGTPVGGGGGGGGGGSHGLGIDLGSATPGTGGMGGATPLLQSVGMTATMSEIMGVVGVKRNEDEERRLKMRRILHTIGVRKGRSCEESIVRLARRVGMEVDEMELRDRSKAGHRTVSMAGSAKVIVDVRLRHDAATDVSVSLMGSPALMAQQEAASKVLLRDLHVPNGILLHAHLDRFAANLGKLATLDALSTPAHGGVDCFEAITGVYTSLRKLYELEKDAVKALGKFSASEADRRAEHEVLCKKSGKPAVHENGKIGLSLAYWTTGSAPSEQDGTAMDVDGNEDADPSSTQPQTWTLEIDVEKSPAGLYPSLRLSDAWLPDFFELPTSESGEGIPWQEPPTTYASPVADDKNDAMSMGAQRLPDLRFVAKFDPPLVVPLQTAMNILNLVGAQPPATNIFPLYHCSVLNIPLHQQNQHKIRAEIEVLASGEAEDEVIKHRYVLDLSQAQLSWKLERLPFSHPRQLVELLPTLRQWASIGSLLHGTFGSDPAGSEIDAATSGLDATHLHAADTPAANSAIEMDALAGDVEARPAADLELDVGFATSPHPTISIAWADVERTDVRNVVAQVLPNGDVLVTDSDGVGHDHDATSGGAQPRAHATKLAKALELCQDIGVWVEWMRKMKSCREPGLHPSHQLQ